jgi:hypothetical protein
MLHNTILLGYWAEIGLYLWAHGVFTTPIGIQSKAIWVKVRSNLFLVSPGPDLKMVGVFEETRRNVTYITSTSRICIRQPCSTNILALLDELKVPYAKFSNYLYGKTEATHARSYYQNFCIERHCESLEPLFWKKKEK